MADYTVTLDKVIDNFQFECVSCGDKVKNIQITTTELNRPGIHLTGFVQYFSPERIQIMGTTEMEYLRSFTPEIRMEKLAAFFELGFPCMIISRNQEIFGEILECSEIYGIPVLRSGDITSTLTSTLYSYLNIELAPRTNMHGVFVEVYGEGILILGDSGAGKSETALEIVKRGHRLVADDNVEVRKVSEKTLVGTSPDVIRHFIEIRGLGILDVKNLYGVGAVKMTENINLVVNLETWDDKKEYERLGLEDQYMEILGISVPSLIVPVGPGRNLAIIIEVAAMNNRQRKMGYNAAKALAERLQTDRKGESNEAFD
jgi:HPr kinase/phosphorylase